MALNWVMLSDTDPFVPLAGETVIYTSPARTSFSLKTRSSNYPGSQPISCTSDSGTVFLTNQRIVYLPAKPDEDLKSFSAPIMNVHDSRVSVPFLGPNVWLAAVQPVPGGNIPISHTLVDLRMSFKDGGAFDFHQHFERIKERLQQAVEVARESGFTAGDGSETGPARGAGALSGVNLAAVHLEQLPAYEEATATPVVLSSSVSNPSVRPPVFGHDQRSDGEAHIEDAEHDSTSTGFHVLPPAPLEPPPDYEEAQRESVATELERTLRNSDAT